MNEHVEITEGVNDSYEDFIIDDVKDVYGHIYLITNIETNKQYIGQCVSHRKNHAKYRPYGYIRRFKTHYSTAICNTKKAQCGYLYNAMRKYGIDKFTTHLLCKCKMSEIDDKEREYIEKYKTLYPTGYNLTTGGKHTRYIPHHLQENKLAPPKKRGGCKFRSEETRKLMSEQGKKYTKNPVVINLRKQRAQKQHAANKYKKFADVEIEPEKINSYIKERCAKGIRFVIVSISGITVSFYGKYESIEIQHERANAFIQSLIAKRATLLNCSGTP